MALQQKLLEWFEKNARPLPWRRKYRPYEVWVSEIMLQQTQVETVLPYFDRWMKAFPDVATLAKADEKKVLKLWEGLGYYSRARNLHETAKEIVRKHGSAFPSDFEKIRSLKGIGPYTAGAIASIAFNQDRPIVDGNVLRVLSRLYAIEKPIDVEANKTIFWELQEKLIPKGKARWFNQALMELGALVCRKDSPGCGQCPAAPFCQARKLGRVKDFPVRKKKKTVTKVQAGAVVLSRNSRYLLLKRPVGKIMGGLWEFPEWKLAQGGELSREEAMREASRLARSELGLELKNLYPLGIVRRHYTRFAETLHVFMASGSAKQKVKLKEDWRLAWAAKSEFKNYPFSSAHAKIAESLQKLML